MKIVFSKESVIQSVLALSIALSTQIAVQASEGSGVTQSGECHFQGNTSEGVPPEQTGAPVPGPIPAPGPGPGPGGGYVGPLWECMANNADCTVFWVIDVNPNLAQNVAMTNCFNFPSQACRPLGCHQLPAPY